MALSAQKGYIETFKK